VYLFLGPRGASKDGEGRKERMSEVGRHTRGCE
jgi:hypothetical protein